MPGSPVRRFTITETDDTGKIQPFQKCTAAFAILRERNPAAREVLEQVIALSVEAEPPPPARFAVINRMQRVARLMMADEYLQTRLETALASLPATSEERKAYFHAVIQPMLSASEPLLAQQSSLPIVRDYALTR